MGLVQKVQLFVLYTERNVTDGNFDQVWKYFTVKTVLFLKRLNATSVYHIVSREINSIQNMLNHTQSGRSC